MIQVPPADREPVRHLYVHIPFCHRICPYCGFYKHTPGATDRKRFIAALVAEAHHAAATIPLDIETVFFGGGTPTLLSHTHLELLLDGLHQTLPLSNVREWTFEANPKTFDRAKLEILRTHGATRLSLGVQSWNSQFLQLLGRDHTPEGARESFELARQSGFPSLGIDLMFALPGQTIDQWRVDIDTTLDLQPDHISTYNLTYEEDTEFMQRFERGEFHQDPDADAPFFLLAAEKIPAKGYHHYEISNYARPGHASQHNSAYWKGSSYLGLGPSAVSTIHRQRWTNIPDTTRYIEAVESFHHARGSAETLTDNDWRTERLALALRTSQGIALEMVGGPHNPTVQSLLEQNLAHIRQTHLALTRKGRLLADTIATELL